VLDEAHSMSDATLEDVRLLTIADFDRKSPFLLLLAGQPGIEDRLAEPCHRALDQRITTVARLNPLSKQQTREYIERRLKAAGAKAAVFEAEASDAIYQAATGIPRRINTLATSALIIAAARKHKTVSAQDVNDARLDRGRS
jgi:type II secretory pathway predicted ATPase ExeA